MLTDAEIEQLGSQGYFVRDSFLGHALALEAIGEASAVPLRAAGVSRTGEVVDSVRSDEMAWLTESESPAALREVYARFAQLMRSLNEGAWLGLKRFDLQLARYRPGAKYVRHFDAFRGEESRRITAIVYLNRQWVREHGGQLRLLVEPPCEVEPLLDRLIVFRADTVEHEVVTACADRWAITAWYSATVL